MIEGHINYLVPKGTPFKLRLSSVPTNGMKLLDRDMDGKFYPAKEGQEISAKTSEDFYVDDNKVIPEGTTFHGTVSKIVPPRHVGRPGWLEISFDRLTTPDGKVFAFKAQADNFKPSTVKSKAKGLGRLTAYAGGGGVLGAMVAYQIFGLHTTIAMHGWNIVGGAGGGALLATCYALWKRGSPATLEPGDDLNMNIDCDLLMPAAVDPKSKPRFVNKPGINVRVTSAKVIKDGLEGNMLRVKAIVDNETDDPLRSIDLFAEDANGNKLPLIAGPDDTSQFLFEVGAHSRSILTMHFLMEHPKLKCQLVWLDHDNRQICYRAPLMVAKDKK
jgi:hypothetical protein